MMKFRAHCPGYVDGFSHPGAEGTLAEILADPWIASWATDPTFHRWSLSENRLIAEQDGGDSQWVVGYLDPPPVGELPTWVESPKARLRREAWNRGDVAEHARLR
jgi:hypothetical protein